MTVRPLGATALTTLILLFFVAGCSESPQPERRSAVPTFNVLEIEEWHTVIGHLLRHLPSVSRVHPVILG